MQTRAPKRFRHTAVNVLIIALIAAIYLCMQRPPATLAVMSSSVIYQGRSEDSVALQFIVQWDAQALPDIISTLNDKNVRATFFVSGKWAENNSDTLIQLIREGHELGTLGYAPDSDGDRDWLIEDISRSLDIIKTKTGYDCKLYYCGDRDIGNSSRAANALGLKNVRCTLDLLCARGDSRDIINRVPESLRGGAILLMAPTRSAVQALPSVIDILVSRGLALIPTGRILES